jgi:hypothetical protein
MKQITLPSSTRVHIPHDGSGVDLQEVDTLKEISRRNKMAIIECGLAIEWHLELIIANYFFEPPETKKKLFEDIVLRSDWCTFSAKRKLINYIVNELELLTGKDKNDFDQLIINAMNIRNAFTHGRLSTDGKMICLGFFQSQPQTKELSDEYLMEVENTLFDAHKKTDLLLMALLNKLGTAETVTLF